MITRLLGRLWKLPSPAFAVDRVQDLPVPMRDRENLLTDIYHPRTAQSPPTVLMRTPYGRGKLFVLIARLFAEQGYTTVIQSVRGTFGSGGQFDPFFQERDDGVDTVAWIERQPWYHGKLGLYGAAWRQGCRHDHRHDHERLSRGDIRGGRLSARGLCQMDRRTRYARANFYPGPDPKRASVRRSASRPLLQPAIEDP
jgi:hypothetical protein